jgi:predicted branched-subunit amino acid permease
LTPRRAFVAGARAAAPIALSGIPFGAAAGLAAANVGMSPAAAVAMSVVVFAGAAQLAVLELTRAGAPELVVIAVAVTINLRFGMYSAALAGWLRPRSLLRRIGMAYLLTDQAFAITSARGDDDDTGRHGGTFYAGAALALWVAWQLGTALGAVAGVQVPEGLGIDFVAPLAFVALGVLAIRSRADAAAAATAVVGYVALSWLPLQLALLPASALGLVAGRIVESRAR